ncbi:putative C6 transcription factor Aro80 [Aspergillus terreus]|uniref:Putative C6 transcription factor Aro80 n=1 Tax=Aspergillus terreus TaxID=33178 RepID=A0A5M3Z731_ASPTE|nr:hypothetical protein ATETN484_0010007700 [Aspergillus terreus]GFF18127.1 putative C6 transcription factor Aro80 [Aspergillus terreus]
MAPYTPIITDFYAHHANHYWLITQEPTLCCVILLISSRHSVLSNAGGSSREQSIHNRLWQHCQHLILRIILGQEKLSKAKTRHIGSIEALMLLAEWYPRALHFPPENDGWDSDLILTVPDERDPPLPTEETVMLKERWREDVVEPARRADRLAWMVLSSALALSHELGIFRSTPDHGLPSKDTALGAGNNPLSDILNIEYQYVVVFINSIKLQSKVTELLSHSGPEVRHQLNSRDTEPVEQIMTNACSILRWITKLENHIPNPIQYLPISIFHRAISTSIFLLKTLAFGVRTVQVQECLALLDEVSDILQAHALDDIHLVSRYATLLKIHVERFRKSFTNVYVCEPATEHALPEHLLDQHIFGWPDGIAPDPSDWLSFPLDPLMAPFGTWDGTGQFDSGLDSTYLDLDFIWNLPP